jgi:hypothetical protein
MITKGSRERKEKHLYPTSRMGNRKAEVNTHQPSQVTRGYLLLE